MISALINMITVKPIHKEVLLTSSHFQLFITKFLYMHMKVLKVGGYYFPWIYQNQDLIHKFQI